MSKQDGYSSRTAVDLERKYNFGKTFAEVYDLVSEAQRAAQEAQNAFDGLNQEQIFNLLTNYGEWQGIYRDDNGDVYVNASFIKGGTISGDTVKVDAATITGQLVATQIDTKDLKVLAANITGTLTAGQIDTTNLKVSAANVTGKLSASQINTTYLEVSAANITGMLSADQIDTDELTVNAANVSGTLDAGNISMNGSFKVKSGGSTYGYVGASDFGDTAGAVLCNSTTQNGVLVTNTGAQLIYGATSSEPKKIWAASGGCYSSHTMQVWSDKRLKKNISYELAEEEKLFMRLKPCSFQMNNDKAEKRHWGFVVQDVIAGAEEVGMNTDKLAIISKYEEMYSLGYGEMIALNTHMIQKLMARMARLEEA